MTMVNNPTFARSFGARLTFALFVVSVFLQADSLRLIRADDGERANEIEVFKDVNFERGFKVVDIARSPRDVGDLKLTLAPKDGKERMKPVWRLAQHNSRYDLPTAEIVSDSNSAVAETPGQRVALERTEKGEVVLTLGVSTDKEYDHPRRADEPWIHLLLVQDFPVGARVLFKDVDSLVFSCDARVLDWEYLGEPSDFNPAIHATQASVYFAIPNVAPDSPDRDDYVWFGVSFFDDRYEVQTDYVERDGDPKKIGTGKLIYRLGGQKTIDDLWGGVNPYSKAWAHLEIDLKKYLADALEAAKERGMLKNSSVDDMALAHFNFGWETPGTYRSTMQVKNLHIVAKMKEGDAKAK